MAQDTFLPVKKTLNIGGNLTDLSTPRVMGILNITPDSFYGPSRVPDEKVWLTQAEKMIGEGALILDVGGYSSRPGATDVAESEEIERVIPAIRSIKKQFPEVFLSVDTFRSEVARRAAGEGADMINDISAGERDSRMFETVAELKLPYVMMHMKGTPQTMKGLAHYDDMVLELLDYFQKKSYALRELGVNDIIVDPGFGFAKNVAQNFELLKRMEAFRVLGLPLLVGLSRKSMICKSLGIEAGEALNGTTVLNTIALVKGASILRVHDVKEAMETIRLYNLVVS